MTPSPPQFFGISFSGLLTILFIGLKFTGFIDWSWWWVLSPLWISLSIVVVILGILWTALLLWVAIQDDEEGDNHA